MGSPLGNVVNSYATLASSLLDRWSAQASNVASKLDAAEYDANDAAADLAACASLASESGLLLAAEALDALAVLGGGAQGPYTVTSQSFKAPAGARLQLAGPLESGAGSASIPEGLVTIHPAQLPANKTDFHLRVNAAECRGRTYSGTVQAFVGNNAPVPVNVWITVA